MPKYKLQSNAVILVTKEDLLMYATTYRNRSHSFKFTEYVKGQMVPQVPDYQDVEIEIEEDLAGAETKSFDLSGVDLSDIIFNNRALINVSFAESNLSGVEFKGGKVLARFDGANLQGAKFFGVDLLGSSFDSIVTDVNTTLVPTHKLPKEIPISRAYEIGSFGKKTGNQTIVKTGLLKMEKKVRQHMPAITAIGAGMGSAISGAVTGPYNWRYYGLGSPGSWNNDRWDNWGSLGGGDWYVFR